jgi:hypothetical protein
MKDSHSDNLDIIVTEIKHLQDLIEAAVEWNFGRAPDEPWFDERVNRHNELLDVVKAQDFGTYRNLVDELFGG